MFAVKESSDSYYLGEVDYHPGITFFGGMHRPVDARRITAPFAPCGPQ
jgi:hypothetical protein